MKYIIDIPPECVSPSGVLWFKSTYTNVTTNIKAETYTEPDREAIENEVWEFCRMLDRDVDLDDLDEIYGDSDDLYTKYTYQEAKKLYSDWATKSPKPGEIGALPCENCLYTDKKEWESPCNKCTHSYIDMWRAKK